MKIPRPAVAGLRGALILVLLQMISLTLLLLKQRLND